TTPIHPLSLHDALPISISATSHAGRPIPPPIPSTPKMTAPLCRRLRGQIAIGACRSTMRPHDQATPLVPTYRGTRRVRQSADPRSEEHTSELQSRENLV